MRTRQKLAIATWSPPSEGNIFGKLVLDCTEANAYIAWKRETTGEKVTMTHFVGKACAMALAQASDLNSVIRLGRLVRRRTVDIAYLVALEEGANLAKAKIERLDEKPVEAVAAELRELAERLKSGRDEDFAKTQNPLKILPTWLIRPLVTVMGYLSGVLGLEVKALGVEPFPFGSCIITNVGVFGLDEGFAPHTPFAHVPILVLMGAVRDGPWVEDGELVVRPQITITATIDHRYMDGAQGGILARVMREIFANPWALDGLQGPPGEE